MSTLTVANVETANASTDLTLMTGNSSGPKLVITAGGNILLNNINANTIILNTVANPYTTNNLTVTKQLNLTSNVTPANLGTNNTVDWDPGVAGDYQIRFQANSTNATILEYNVYGLTGGVSGQIITLTNIGPTRVVLRTEEAGNSTFNQANSVNRFSLPNHISLEGYQSIELYYDGTLQRWRGVDTQGFPFFYKQGSTKGFFLGGETTAPAVSGIADRCTYSTETTAAVSGANLSQARRTMRSVGNADKGFTASGSSTNPTTTYSSTTDRTVRSTEVTAAVSGAALSTSKYLHNCIGNVDKGIFSGGLSPTSPANPGPGTSDRTTYSTETTALISGGNLSQARQQQGGISNSDKGFFGGGYASAALVATTDRTFFNTETNSAVSGANLSVARQEADGLSNQDKGFFSGGSSAPAFARVTTTDRTTYSTETTAAVSGANLSQARGSTENAGNSDKGFYAGGLGVSPTTPYVTTADRCTYSTETTAAVSGANLSQIRGHGGGF